AHAVDDRGVVERVGDDRVLLAQQRLEQPAVGIEAGGVEDRVLGAEEIGDGLLELLVQVLGAADEAHRGHAEAVRVQRFLRRLDHRRMVGQAQVVVGAEVEHRAPVVERDLRRLRAGDDALGLEQPGLADLAEGVLVLPRQTHDSTTLPLLPLSIRSKPSWKRSTGSWWVSALPSGKPLSTSWVILYQVSYILRP